MESPVQAVGIDVSKATLDIALFHTPSCRSRRVRNHPHDFAGLLRWMQAHACGPLHVCLEPTGTYHDAIVAFLLEQGVTVSLVPPAQVAAFRKSLGSRHKTDKQDAILLATYAQQKHPAAFVAVPDTLMELRQMLSRLDQLEHMRQQERNRQENGRIGSWEKAQLAEHLQQLTTWHTELFKRIRAWIKEREDLQQAVNLLTSLKGIGEHTGWRLLAVLGPDGRRFGSAHQLVVYLGLDVVHYESGTSVKSAGHISKQGSGRLRRALGMCAIVAKRWDADMAQWAAALTARGKKPLVVRVALMRKLVHLAFGVLKHQHLYDACLAWPTHAHPGVQEVQAA